MPTWRALTRARQVGKVRAIGVSNYSIHQIDQLIDTTGVTPAVNQVPWNPRAHDPQVLAAHRARGIIVEGYSPLRGTDLHHPTITTIAHDHAVTPAEVVLHWHLQHGVPVIPKSSDPQHMTTNLRSWRLPLSAHHLTAIDNLAPDAQQRGQT